MYVSHEPRLDCHYMRVGTLLWFWIFACVVVVDDRCASGIPIEGVDVACASTVALADDDSNALVTQANEYHSCCLSPGPRLARLFLNAMREVPVKKGSDHEFMSST